MNHQNIQRPSTATLAKVAQAQLERRTREAAMGLPPAWPLLVLPRPPTPWRMIKIQEDGYAYDHTLTGLRVIASGAVEDDGKRWLHVSASYANHLPTYKELSEVKRDFIGSERYAYQVFAPAKQHVNFHPYVLHLWCCLDVPEGRYLPDFTSGTGSV